MNIATNKERRGKKPALLVLADGMVFHGYALGHEGQTGGEVVFNTAMTGYQEILTDPSYKGQLVAMTCPHIGNYGTTSEDSESRAVWAEGLIVREAARLPSNWRSTASLHDYLQRNRVVAIEGVDTRALTRHVRDYGSQYGIIAHDVSSTDSLIEQARNAPSIVGRDLVAAVTCSRSYDWTEGSQEWKPNIAVTDGPSPVATSRYWRVVVMDFGVKYTILRRLVDVGCQVQVVPASTSASAIQALQPDGIVLSNGPGDPQGVPYAVDTVRQLLGWRPMLGICLGHQIIGLALGLTSHKLKFGHHGANHPVIDLRSRKVEITSQNHNFAVGGTHEHRQHNRGIEEFDTPWGRVSITHRSLNDGCCEGLMGKDLPFFSLQYHPEASPGPHDSSSVFRHFTQLIERQAHA
ncbi:MAG: carbamoyl-phosphate synthase small subunit [Nitrospirae bacterium]|nr:MAG: carbamoyl-phosphate synthase small subunit [Nitrospirota bacterium]